MASNTEKSYMNYICMYVVCGNVFFLNKCAAIIGSLKIIHPCICELKVF